MRGAMRPAMTFKPKDSLLGPATKARYFIGYIIAADAHHPGLRIGVMLQVAPAIRKKYRPPGLPGPGPGHRPPGFCEEGSCPSFNASPAVFYLDQGAEKARQPETGRPPGRSIPTPLFLPQAFRHRSRRLPHLLPPTVNMTAAGRGVIPGPSAPAAMAHHPHLFP